MSTLSHEEIRRLCGDVPDEKMVRILASGASVEDLEIALAWAAGESDVMGKERHALSGVAAELYDILAGDEEWQDERAAPR